MVRTFNTAGRSRRTSPTATVAPLGHDPEVSKASAPNDEKGSRTTIFGAYLHRKPSCYFETTGTGGLREGDVDEYVAGQMRALRHLRILSSAPVVEGCRRFTMLQPTPRLDHVDPAPWASAPAPKRPKRRKAAPAAAPSTTGHLQSQNLTPVSGLFRSRVALWDEVEVGDLLAEVSDAADPTAPKFELRAAKAGHVILLRHLARVEAGDFLCVVI